MPDDALFLLQRDLLTFQALGISLPLTSLSTRANDPHSPLPGDHYVALLRALMRALSLSMRPVHTADFHTLLPSLLSDLLIPILKTTLTPQERIPPLHIATIHWLSSQ